MNRYDNGNQKIMMFCLIRLGLFLMVFDDV